MRPGRFDRQVLVDRPDKRGREKILEIHAQEREARRRTWTSRSIAARTPGFAGADLANVVNEAALLAARRNKSAVTRARVRGGHRARRGGPREEEPPHQRAREGDRRVPRGGPRARVAGCCPYADRVTKVSIIPRGLGALGYTLQLPLEDRYLLTLAASCATTWPGSWAGASPRRRSSASRPPAPRTTCSRRPASPG